MLCTVLILPCDHHSLSEDLSESFRRILESVQKIDPMAGAGYILNDHQGMRYFYIDYNKESE